jgi:hypothetical protein
MTIHECKTCEFSTKNNTDLERHKLTKKHIKNIENINSDGEFIVKLEKCNFNNDEDKKHNCVECNKSFKHKQKKHDCHKNSENIYSCKKCGKEFKSKTSMYRHVRKYCKYKNKILEDEIKELKKEIEELKKQLEVKIKKSKKNNIPKSVRIATWNKNFGKKCGEHECYIGCGKLIHQGDFECGHIIAESKGGLTHVDNLKPICSQCNRSMQTQNLEEYKYNYFKQKINNSDSDSDSDYINFD